MSGRSIEPAQIYSISELNQQTASVLDKINNSGRPAAITRHGRFVALVYPLAGVEIESVVLSQGPLADEFRGYAREVEHDENMLSPDEVEAAIRYQDGHFEPQDGHAD